MHANRIHVNTVERVQRMELITCARVSLGMKATIAMKVGVVFPQSVNSLFHFTTVVTLFVCQCKSWTVIYTTH